MTQEVLRLPPSTIFVALPKERFDPRADLFMTGRIGMDAVQQQMLIGPASSPRGKEINLLYFPLSESEEQATSGKPSGRVRVSCLPST
jgi:hypothetical protein